jgi:hypothetical protein
MYKMKAVAHRRTAVLAGSDKVNHKFRQLSRMWKSGKGNYGHYRGEFIAAGLITDSQEDKNRFYSVWLTPGCNWKPGKVRTPGADFRKAIATSAIHITQSIDDEAAQLINGKSTPPRIRTSVSSNPTQPEATRSRRFSKRTRCTWSRRRTGQKAVRTGSRSQQRRRARRSILFCFCCVCHWCKTAVFP